MVDKKQMNIEFFRAQLATLLANPLLRGKFLVVHDQQVKQSFDTFDSALRYAVSQFPPEEFIVQQVVEDNEVINFLRAAL